VQFRRISLNPAPDGDVIDVEVALHYQFLQIAKAEREPQIPANAQNADL
jgi:hypothetical protein